MNRTDIVPQADDSAQKQNTGNAVTGMFKGKKSNNIFVGEIRARIDAYFKLVLRSVRDSIPKTIGYFLVRATQEKL